MSRITSRTAHVLALVGLAVVICGADPKCPPEQEGAKGIAIAIGLNSVDPNHYAGWSGDLTGCEPDAHDMAQIASSQKLDTEIILTAEATRANVLKAIRDASKKVKSGDLFVLSYSGHGGQLPDQNGDEADGHDETWCLYDGQLMDDEIHAALADFKKDVRVLCFSDSCHSGTVLKMLPGDLKAPQPGRIEELDRQFRDQTIEMRKKLQVREIPRIRRGLARRAVRPGEAALVDEETIEEVKPAELVVRAMDPGTAYRTYINNKALYDKIGGEAPREDKVNVKCSAILISGCKDDQWSADVGTNGLFTLMLKNVWDNGAFAGDHPAFHQQIRNEVMQVYAVQQPNYFKVGKWPAVPFESQRPYTISP